METERKANLLTLTVEYEKKMIPELKLVKKNFIKN